jgi:DNA ligase (NAD+)
MNIDDMMKKRIDDLTKTIKRHDYLYHIKNAPEISDFEYDRMFEELKKLEKEYPQYKHEDTPTKQVGGLSENVDTTITHMNKMYSMSNVFSYEEFYKWITLKGLSGDALVYGDLKLDGLALSLYYEDGKLVNISTRGDGSKGEDVSRHMLTIKGLVPTIPIKDRLEIYGEAILSYKNYHNLNGIVRQEGVSGYANQRNAVAGLLHSKYSPFLKYVNFIAYNSNIEGYSCHNEMMSDLQSFGFDIPDFILVKLKSIHEAEDFHEKYNSIPIDKLEIPCDGTVWKIDDKSIQAELGYTDKYPKHSKAWKFVDTEVRTKIDDIIYQVGRTGVITPVAIVDEVTINGAKISKVTLHNEDFIIRNGLGKGNIISIVRSGGVIPKVSKNISKTIDSENFTPLTHCPRCGSPLIKKSPKVKVCSNPQCPAILEARIAYFVSRTGLDIKGFGIELIRPLVEKKVLTRLADIFTLDKKVLVDIIGELRTNKLLDNIVSTMSRMTIDDIIVAIGIPGFDKKSRTALLEYTKDVEVIIALGKDIHKLNTLGMTSKGMTSFLEYITDYGAQELREIAAFGGYQ